jgi:hypothetical protein
MSVETALGISAEMAREIIERRWPDWVAASPALALVDFQDVRRWLRASDCKAAGDALHALAGLAAKSGGDDVEAATVLAWAMLPAACQIANQLRTV